MGNATAGVKEILAIRSIEVAILLQQRDHISDLIGVDGAGFDLVSELNKIALSLSFEP